MLLLKQLLLDCGVTQQELADMAGCCRPHISRALQGRVPVKEKKFKTNIETAITGSKILTAWLRKRGCKVSDIWTAADDDFSLSRPRGFGKKMSGAATKYWKHPAIQPGDPLKTETHKEAEMITPKALRYFKLFRSPFINDITDVKDIFLSEDHIFLKEMMLDTARHAGFTAVFGEVGSGKSIMRKAVVQELVNDGIKVIYPIIIDKTRITPASLIDAIIMDVSDEKPKRSLEPKTRQALKLLRNRAISGMKQALIIEEAHLLNVKAMKALKQIYELEDGFSRLIGIVLIGQTELKFLLDETRHPEMREVTRRVTCAEIGGLGKDLPRYLIHKFVRINKKPEDIFTADAYSAMERRLSDKVGRRNVSKAHPLTVNNFASRAMNLAAEMGEERVTEDVVMSV